MAVVKGSSQYALRVMPYRPMRMVFTYAIIFLALVAIAVSSYLVGYDHGARQVTLPGGPRDQLTQENDELVQELNVLRQQVASFELNTDVDRKANEDIRRQLMEQRAQIAALERDIAVYRGMLSSGGKSNPQGVSVGIFYITPTEQPRRYHYKLVLQKLAATDDQFSGNLDFKLAGVAILNGKEQTGEISLHELSEQFTTAAIPLKFKYFQNIEGELILPEGFTPNKIELLVKSTNRKYPATIEKELEWQVSE